MHNEGNFQSELDELLKEAEVLCNEGQINESEKLLNQLILRGHKRPLVFHLLGTIYYDQGKFNKAIRAFRRALEIEPGFTDSSVGLSIILNDLGRYDEGKKVFEEAKTMLSVKNREDVTVINRKLSEKHDSLGDIYFQHERYQEALREYGLALELHGKQSAIKLKCAECDLRLENFDRAIGSFLEVIHQEPRNSGARIRLGKIYYDSHRVPMAIKEWEDVLSYDPDNVQARDYLRLASSIETVVESDLEMELEGFKESP